MGPEVTVLNVPSPPEPMELARLAASIAICAARPCLGHVGLIAGPPGRITPAGVELLELAASSGS